VRARRARRRTGRKALAACAGLALAACAGATAPGPPLGPGAPSSPAAADAGDAAPAGPPHSGPELPDFEPRGEPAPGFPSPEALVELGEAPVPADLFDRDVKDVDGWRLAGPFPERLEAVPYRETGPWAALVDEAAQRRPGLVVPTQAMYCVARELGRFFLATNGQPSEGLRRFLLARCNATEARVLTGYVDGPVSPGRSDARIFAQWGAVVRESLESRLAGGPRTVGIWYGRLGERAVVMQAFGVREVRVHALSPVPTPAGRIEIRGEFLLPTEQARALVNRGRFGVAPCDRAPVAHAAGFGFVCQVDPRDPSAMIAVSVTRPERLLWTTVLHVLARPEGRLEDTWRAPSYGEPHPLLDPAATDEDFVELLNAARRQAGLAPVELDLEQSAMARELAPPFFASIFGRSPEVNAEMVILGMLAGWSVDGIVQSGHFAASWVMRSNDLQRLLAAALEEPEGRETLLAAGIDRVAIGPLIETADGHESMAAIFGSYALFSEEDHAASVDAVMEKLRSERAARGLGPPEGLGQVTPLCHAAASRVASGELSRDVMRDLLGETVDVLGRPATGWIAEVRDLDELSFPEEYLTRPSLGLALAISHREEPGEPWGRWVVMVVVADTEGDGA
jgi:hypothetical protein